MHCSFWFFILESWLLALGSWLLTLDSWLLALGSWLLALSNHKEHKGFTKRAKGNRKCIAVGSWLLAFGFWLTAQSHCERNRVQRGNPIFQNSRFNFGFASSCRRFCGKSATAPPLCAENNLHRDALLLFSGQSKLKLIAELARFQLNILGVFKGFRWMGRNS